MELEGPVLAALFRDGVFLRVQEFSGEANLAAWADGLSGGADLFGNSAYCMWPEGPLWGLDEFAGQREVARREIGKVLLAKLGGE